MISHILSYKSKAVLLTLYKSIVRTLRILHSGLVSALCKRQIVTQGDATSFHKNDTQTKGLNYEDHLDSRFIHETSEKTPVQYRLQKYLSCTPSTPTNGRFTYPRGRSKFYVLTYLYLNCGH